MKMTASEKRGKVEQLGLLSPVLPTRRTVILVSVVFPVFTTATFSLADVTQIRRHSRCKRLGEAAPLFSLPLNIAMSVTAFTTQPHNEYPPAHCWSS